MYQTTGYQHCLNNFFSFERMRVLLFQFDETKVWSDIQKAKTAKWKKNEFKSTFCHKKKTPHFDNICDLLLDRYMAI